MQQTLWAPEGMTVLVENARARSITPNGNIAFWV